MTSPPTPLTLATATKELTVIPWRQPPQSSSSPPQGPQHHLALHFILEIACQDSQFKFWNQPPQCNSGNPHSPQNHFAPHFILALACQDSQFNFKFTEIAIHFAIYFLCLSRPFSCPHLMSSSRYYQFNWFFKFRLSFKTIFSKWPCSCHTSFVLLDWLSSLPSVPNNTGWSIHTQRALCGLLTLAYHLYGCFLVCNP